VIRGVSRLRLEELYGTMIGKRVVERSYGFRTWEGEVVGLALTINGIPDEMSLDSELWHNKVKTQYTYPSAVDREQGNLSYTTIGGDDVLQDDAQDFSDYEVLAGDATHEIRVTNDDGSVCSGYMGEADTKTNPDDSIYVFKDQGRGLAGWNGTTGGKTPSSYIVSEIGMSGTQQETAWSENTGSSDIYGESQYIEVLPEECYAATAEASRDRRLSEYAYPRSMSSGGLAYDGSGGGSQGDGELVVTCAGYVFSMNRRYYETNVEPLAVSTQIRTLVAASEYVTDGGIASNAKLIALTGDDMAFKLWDGIESMIHLGDGSDRFVGGVYEGRLFRYDVAETAMLYEWRNGRLRYVTGQRVPPTFIRPDIIVRRQAPLRIAPPGATEIGNPTRAYVTECEFIAPRNYRLTTDAGDVLVGGY